MLNNYQLTLLVNTKVDEKEREALLDSIEKKVKKVEKKDLWGNRDLSYPIKHQNKAYYAHFEIEAESKEITDLDKILKLNEDILRYLIIRKG
ncbi:MAG: 30S ribosomal protein S6 [Candidatus Daviesbacteria bacterium GW2011_GWA2_38_24]|uniref:Small ribosomal subunit protein bS6 n=1 Tax=Candidatus Daviesbacteria bacterium GW2011_GWA2_38_24 TaxID=1618422 RepID=A0A0G0MJB0_9BACT|nr:MAG: 30S ribosomal protein S6 [Candidatus Daviesbacteria bacterium GW2011_GWA2_38_24]KKQ79874.1 MAG: 30S ribosomal protein S6 [Candidatus Daviesbacteria bacterium GW2011_GWA1_38_7]